MPRATPNEMKNSNSQPSGMIDRSGNLRVDWKMTSHEELEKSRDRNKTALDYANYSGQDEIIKTLLAAGARAGRPPMPALA